jgi:hypothetical protein
MSKAHRARKDESMAMTVAKLHKILSEQIDQGHGTRRVGIDLDTFPESSDDANIADAFAANPTWIAESDGDGYVAHNTDGSERGCTMLILSGNYSR